jgi:hypothetical protein
MIGKRSEQIESMMKKLRDESRRRSHGHKKGTGAQGHTYLGVPWESFSFRDLSWRRQFSALLLVSAIKAPRTTNNETKSMVSFSNSDMINLLEIR